MRSVANRLGVLFLSAMVVQVNVNAVDALQTRPAGGEV